MDLKCLHISKTPLELAQAKESCRVSTAKWRGKKKKGHTTSANPQNPPSQIAQASCHQSIIANILSYALYEPPSQLYSSDEIVKMVKFYDVRNSDTYSNSDDAKISTKSLRGITTVCNTNEHLSGTILEPNYILKDQIYLIIFVDAYAEGLLHKAWALHYNCSKKSVVRNKTFNVILFY